MKAEKRDWYPGKKRFEEAVTVVIARRVPKDKVQDFKDKVEAIIQSYK
ncbi:hypothetical protein [Flavobacterium akiainvivens]|nr:hypothetical protein [Flavobacterium akiainvivens]SFQ39842.1 hypothetical protein SAMN05444144_1045 [Flavobacterium akiainvivens]